jgi:LuxR family maltose regulon positive regulatory protein
MQELDNELRLAAGTYEDTIQLAVDLPYPMISEVHLGLGRILYEWNDLDAAWERGQKSLVLARLLQNTDRPMACGILLARITLARGDPDEASRILDEAERSVREPELARELPNVAAVRALVRLARGDVEGAERIAAEFGLSLVQARVCLARNEIAGALGALEPFRRHAESCGWRDDRLRAVVLEALARFAGGGREDRADALVLLGKAMDEAEPEGFVRLFVDEGSLMAGLLRAALVAGVHPKYSRRLLDAMADQGGFAAAPVTTFGLVEPLSKRELEVLGLIAEGLSNKEIAQRLFVSPQTSKVHVRNIYSKLDARSRTQAVARARRLGLLDVG